MSLWQNTPFPKGETKLTAITVNSQMIFKIFTVRFSSKFSRKVLKVPPHLICVATLPCETLIFLENERQLQTNAVINHKLQGTVVTYLSCGGIVGQVWESATVPEDWRQGIIVYKGKGSRSECKNYRGITRLSVPGKVFMHVILSCIKSTQPCWVVEDQQSGFTPNRSTTDRIPTRCNLAQQRREFGRPMYTAYVDFRATFDSLNRPALWLLLALFCSLSVLDPRVGHTMDVFSPFIPVLCHSDWLFHGESCLGMVELCDYARA